MGRVRSVAADRGRVGHRRRLVRVYGQLPGGIRPLFGPVPGLDGLVIATGLGATGLTMGPLAGALAAQSALGLPPAINLDPYTPLPAPPAAQ